MSVRATYRFSRIPEWILLHPDLNGTDVRVFGVLDRFDGRDCFPAIATVADKIHCSRRTVENSLASLEAAGAIRRENRTADGRKTSNRYHLAGDRPLRIDAQDSADTYTQEPAHTGGSNLAHNPEQEEREQEDPEKPAVLAVARPRNELWDALVDEVGPAETRTEASRRGKIVKELKAAGATPQDIHTRCVEYRLRWPGIALTDTALVKHWSHMGVPATPNVGKGTAKLLRMMGEALQEEANEANGSDRGSGDPRRLNQRLE